MDSGDKKWPSQMQCGSTARVARDLCLRCMLLLGIAACGDTSEMLNDAVSEIDV